MKNTFKVACIQTSSGANVQDNLDSAWDIVRKARDAGADLIALPEAANVMASDKVTLNLKTEPEENNHALLAFQDMAHKTGAWVLVGSLLIDMPDTDKMSNRSYLLDDKGAICARYDLRFAYLYRALGHAGAQMLSIPSAFTQVSGRAHWHVLQRARAIETGCYVIAPAQCGDHPGNRKTYGHSLIVDPWGEVIADGGEGIGFIIADIDLTKVDEARSKIPSIRHDRDFELIKN